MGEEQTVRYHVQRREFLNDDPTMPGFIIGIVQDTSSMTDQNECWKYGTVVLDLADCYRRVSFSFDLSEPETRRDGLKKINLLAEVVNAVRDAIEMEVESRDARANKQELAISNSAK